MVFCSPLHFQLVILVVNTLATPASTVNCTVHILDVSHAVLDFTKIPMEWINVYNALNISPPSAMVQEALVIVVSVLFLTHQSQVMQTCSNLRRNLIRLI